MQNYCKSFKQKQCPVLNYELANRNNIFQDDKYGNLLSAFDQAIRKVSIGIHNDFYGYKQIIVLLKIEIWK